MRERIDWERKFHKLDRGQSTLVEEHKKAVADSRKMAAERSAVNEARDASAADAARLTSELRSAKAEVARLKEGEREGAEERQRLIQINERKRAQLEATERDLAAAHSSLTAAKTATADAERKAAEAQAEMHAAKMQVPPRDIGAGDLGGAYARNGGLPVCFLPSCPPPFWLTCMRAPSPPTDPSSPRSPSLPPPSSIAGEHAAGPARARHAPRFAGRGVRRAPHGREHLAA